MMINRIKPFQIPADKCETREIYYPLWFYVFQYKVKRKIFSDIEGMFVIIVDGITGKGYLADIVPDIENIEINEKTSKVLKPHITQAESLKIATEKAEAFLFRKYAYLNFVYKVKHQIFTYKLFWAKKQDNDRYLITDSITGEKIEVHEIK